MSDLGVQRPTRPLHRLRRCPSENPRLDSNVRLSGYQADSRERPTRPTAKAPHLTHCKNRISNSVRQPAPPWPRSRPRGRMRAPASDLGSGVGWSMAPSGRLATEAGVRSPKAAKTSMPGSAGKWPSRPDWASAFSFRGCRCISRPVNPREGSRPLDQRRDRHACHRQPAGAHQPRPAGR
jgi:hypothetical protein